MSVDLPEPSPDGDVWGAELNTAIELVEQIAEDAAAAAATNVSVTASDPQTLDIAYGLESATLIKSDAISAANGVASLDGASKIPVSQLGNQTTEAIGAAKISHQHSLSDIPQAALAINYAPAVAVFNTGTLKWPLRTDLTTSPTRPVIWMGDADIPTYAVPLVDMFFGPRKSGTTTTTPTPPSNPTATPDANGITQTAPVVTLTGSTFNITANITTTNAKTFAYLQLAVRGPAGENLDTGYNNGAVVNTTTLGITGSGTATATGTWTVALAYNITGAAGTWVNGPSTSFSVTTLGGVPTTPGNGTPGSGAFPVLGRSGKTWNSGVCDASNGDVTACNAFFSYRGSPGDAIMIFPGRGDWNSLRFWPDGLTAWPGYRVIAVPSQPTTLTNAYTAAGSANAFWLQYGQDLHAKGWDDGRTILRLNWEANGNWYTWAWQNGGAAQFVSAFKNVVNNIRIGCPTIKIDLCLNRGNVNGGVNWSTQIVDPLIGWLDILALDNYDFSPPSFNDTQFNSMAAIDPGLTSIANKCRAKGLKMSIDEWGVCDTVSSFPGGFDNPYYITKMQAWMAANADVFAMDLYFNINADGLNQRLYPLSESNKPNSSAAYVAAF